MSTAKSAPTDTNGAWAPTRPTSSKNRGPSPTDTTTRGKFPYPSEGTFPIAAPAGGYLWDRAREAGVSYRSYGEFIDNGKHP